MTGDTAAATDDDVVDRPTHRLGGTPAANAGLRVFAPPEEDARLVVDTPPTDGDPIMSVGIRSDCINGRVFLDAAEAEAFAERVAAAVEDLERTEENE